MHAKLAANYFVRLLSKNIPILNCLLGVYDMKLFHYWYCSYNRMIFCLQYFIGIIFANPTLVFMPLLKNKRNAIITQQILCITFIPIAPREA